ncbi:hypothetical protein GN958_ATG07948 [Phytophthora infestans]|uniref:Uncharacterized protein n=1 Tax=Phytophthora infestans TaxID=4787 RepID=A0A8S9UPU0_PHYIN|nr:hypothetical protein GN958_ATG13597 [Phytophthora infestans]KAF4142885.1 hypothetical protein GN958_ATG07948 [Phytophthora infestans]
MTDAVTQAKLSGSIDTPFEISTVFVPGRRSAASDRIRKNGRKNTLRNSALLLCLILSWGRRKFIESRSTEWSAV